MARRSAGRCEWAINVTDFQLIALSGRHNNRKIWKM